MRRFSKQLQLFTLGLAFASCAPSEETTESEAEPSPATELSTPNHATRVEVAIVHPSTAALAMRMPGEVEGSRDADLAAAYGGYVERVLVEEGDEVAEGQVLIRVDTATAGSRVAQAQVELETAERELGRSERLGAAIAGQQRDMAESRVRAARAAVRSARVQGSRATIRAPFAGTVASVHIERGEVAPPGAPLLRLVRLEPIYVSLAVPDRDIVSLRRGMPAAVRAGAGGEPAHGQIVRIAQAADTQTRAFEVLVELENAGRRFLPGMIAEVEIRESVAEESIVIPQHVLVTGHEGNGVFVERAGFATWRDVVLGRVVRDQVVIEQGVSAGDRVIVTGHRELAEGDAVIVVREGGCCTEGRITFGRATATGPMSAETASAEATP